MMELSQNQRELNAPGHGLGGLFNNPHEPSGLVTVAVGPYVERLPVGNSTVGEIRQRFRQRFDIDPRSQAVVDGNEVSDDTVLRTGQVLMFVHKSGEKGLPFWVFDFRFWIGDSRGSRVSGKDASCRTCTSLNPGPALWFSHPNLRSGRVGRRWA